MTTPWKQNYVWRYVVRSKDRISGTPNNFVVQLPNPAPDNATEVWVQLQNLFIDAYPAPGDTATVQAQASTSGLFNQPNFSSTSAYNNYGFDVGGAVDVCITSSSTINTIDTETISASSTYVTSAAITSATGTSITVPIDNKSGIYVSGAGYGGTGDTATMAGISGTMTVTGFTATGVTFSIASQTWATIPAGTQVVVSPAQPYKSRADKTIALLPYSRGENERTIRLWVSQPWVKLTASDLNQLTVKLFSDKGYALKLRKFYANTAADAKDVNIDDWAFEMLVTTKDHLPHGSAPHKI